MVGDADHASAGCGGGIQILCLSLAPGSCQSCPFGQAGSPGIYRDGAGEKDVPVLPKQEPPGEGMLKECLGKVDHPLLLWFPMHQHALSQG